MYAVQKDLHPYAHYRWAKSLLSLKLTQPNHSGLNLFATLLTPRNWSEFTTHPLSRCVFCQFSMGAHPCWAMEGKTSTAVYPDFNSSMDELSDEETTLIIGLCVLIIVIFIILVGSVILCMSLRRGETFLWESAEREARASKQSSLDAIPWLRLCFRCNTHTHIQYW